MSDLVLWKERNGVGHILLNQPELGNVISTPMAHALAGVVQQALVADVGAILISASGKQFCVGGDIREFVQNRDRLPQTIHEILAVLNPTMHTLATLPIPVISAIQGALGGGGIGIGLCADIVLASTTVFLRGGYSAIGLSPDLGSSYYLTRRAGASRAKYLLMSNRPASAQECLRMGIFDELHEPDALAAQALQLAEELAAGATNSLAHIKKLCDEAHSHALQAHLEAERYAISDCAGTANSLEGVNAFLEKRTPVFTRR